MIEKLIEDETKYFNPMLERQKKQPRRCKVYGEMKRFPND
jgi:hypothetical protein